MSGEIDILDRSMFFEGFPSTHLKVLAEAAERVYFSAGDQVVREGEPADAFFLLVSGTVELSSGRVGGAADLGGSGDGTALRTVATPGYPVGWSAMVEPFLHRVTATALTTTTVLRWNRDTLRRYAREQPDFGVAFMRQVLWVVGARLRAARLRLVARRYDAEVVAISALLDQHGETLSIGSPLHKIPAYLSNRLTLPDALAVVEVVQSSEDPTERAIADLVAEILEDVRRELSVYQRLQSIYELVAGADADADCVATREESCRRFVELFDETHHVIRGEEHLPPGAGHIVVMNHLLNHPNNSLPNRFTLTLDSHFVSSMLLYRHYGQAPVRVVRASGRREYGHRRYYDHLGYIYVSSRVAGEESARQIEPASFDEQAAEALAAGRNLVICPEGTSLPTEQSPQRFRRGAFRLAATLSPEPLIVPVAVANFDKQLTRTTTSAVVHPPFRMSEVVDDPHDDAQVLGFLNDRLHPQYAGWVREAVALAARSS